MNQSFPVTQLRRLVLIFAVWNALRAVTTILWRNILFEFSAKPGMWYNMFSGMLWMTAGLWVWWMIAQARRGARKWLLAMIMGFTIWFWAEDLFLLVQPRANWLFLFAVNVVLVVVVYILSNYIEERGV